MHHRFLAICFVFSTLLSYTLAMDAFADPDSLVEFPLDEGSGTVAIDVSALGNNGTLINGPVFEANTPDGSPFSVRFDGTDDYIDLGQLDVDGSGLTLAVWFNPDSFPGPSRDPRLISKASGTSGDDHVFMLSTIKSGSATHLRGRVRIGGVTTTLIATSGNLSTGIWQHAALTYDGATLRLYLNGIEVGSTPLAGAVDIDPALSVAIGAQPPGAGARFFDGLIDDVRILQRALSAAEVNLIVNPTGNQPPLVENDEYDGYENTTLFVDVAVGVLANDSDPDFDGLDVVQASNVSNGALNLYSDGSFDYTPNPDFNGIDSFTYRASDGSLNSDPATVTLMVDGINDPPVAIENSYQAAVGSTLVVNTANGVLSNDSDPERDELQADLENNVSNGTLNLNLDGSFDYTPDPGFSGTDSFSYWATDGSLLSDPATVTIQVSTSSNPDLLVELPLDEGSGFVAGDVSGKGNDGMLINGPVFQTDTPDGSPFSVRFDGTDDYIDLGQLDVDGSSLTLAAWFNPDSFPGQARDPRLISKASGTSGDDHVFMLGTIKSGSATYLRGRIRIGGVTTTLIATSGNLSTGVWQHAALTYDGVTLRLYLNGIEVGSTPLAGAVDIDPTLSVAIGAQPPGAGARFFDGLIDDVRILQRALSAAEVNLIVNPTGNQPPLVENDEYDGYENTTLFVDVAGGVLANDSDPDFDGLEVVQASNVSNGMLNLYSDGSFDYTPNPDFNGIDSFTYRASDGSLNSDPATVTLTVDGINDPPVAIENSYQAAVGSTLVVNTANGVLSNDSDPERDELQADLENNVSNGTLNLNLDGSFDYTPDPGFSGTDSFSYWATDGSLLSDPATVTIQVSTSSNPDLLVELPLDEGSGFVAGDVSGKGNDGMLINGPVFQTDTPDGSPFSVRFDGTDDYIDLGQLDVDGSGLTLAAWFNPDSFPGQARDPRLISKASGTSGDDHVFMLGTIKSGSATYLRGRIRIGGVTTTLIATSGNLSTGIWQHAALTYDGATLRLYLNGIEVGSTPLAGAVDIDPALSVAIGAQPPGAGGRFFDGLIDDVRILQRAMSTEELEEFRVEGGNESELIVFDWDRSVTVAQPWFSLGPTSNVFSKRRLDSSHQLCRGHTLFPCGSILSARRSIDAATVLRLAGQPHQGDMRSNCQCLRNTRHSSYLVCSD